MPEGPEVRREAKRLKRIIANCRITMTAMQREIPGLGESCSGFVNAVIVHGKNLFVRFTDLETSAPRYIHCHMGMRGGWGNRGQYSRAALYYSHEHTDKPVPTTTKEVIYFNGVRFSRISVLSQAEYDEVISKLGPDVKNLTRAQLETALSSLRGELGIALHNQAVISGIGNYLRAEIMWHARISPHRPCNSLSADELTRLYNSIVSTYRTAYEGGYQMQVYRRTIDGTGHPVCREPGSQTLWWSPQLQL
jgi:formamidopyrimidine-DNA glycosylase